MFYSFGTLDWWHLECFDLDVQSLRRCRELAVVCESWSCQATSALVVKDVVHPSPTTCAVSPSPTSLLVLLVNLLLIHFSIRQEMGQVFL